MKANDFLKNLTCLYVEDEDFIRDAFLMMIKRYFKEVLVGKNGEEGLELYKKHKPDIIISDIRMPIKDGIEMVREIKEINPKAYVIFITAFSDTEYLKAAIDLGVEGYITKPVDKKKLIQKLNFIADFIKNEKENEELIKLLKKIFENQIEATVLYEFDNPKLMNKKFIENFEIVSLEEFSKKYNIDLNKKHQQIEVEGEYKKIYNVVIDKLNEKFILISLFDVTNYEHEIFKDQLTGTYNRKFLPKAIEKLMGKKGCIIILDIDDFKLINDTYGHPVGDEVLKELAKILRENLRKDDIVIRFGGEEFVIFLDGVNEIDIAKRIAEHLREKIEKHDFKAPTQVTCSFGVACERINSYKDFEKIYEKSDKALYRAKENGKNRVEIEGFLDESGTSNKR